MGLVSDISGTARTLAGAARRVPGAGFVGRQIVAAERLALREVARRIDRAVASPVQQPEQLPGPRSGSGGTAAGVEEAASVTLDRLLRRSMDQSPSDSAQSLFERLLDELVPDEARILAALSDGSIHPVVHIGGPSRRVLENASSVGRAAGVAAPDMVPTYVTHLLRIGLVELREESTRIREEYDILLTDSSVRPALARAGSGRRGPRITRETVAMSALGHELWAFSRKTGAT